MAHRETPPPIDCDPTVVKPMSRPSVLDRIQSQERKKKERQIDPFPPLSRLPWVAAMELLNQLVIIPEDFCGLPTRTGVSVSGLLNWIMNVLITPCGVEYMIDFSFFQLINDHSVRFIGWLACHRCVYQSSCDTWKGFCFCIIIGMSNL